jgi:WD40 repeat protein
VTPDITSATRLADGRVLLIGNDPTSPQVYDPKTGKFTRTGALPVIPEGATATLLSDGRVLIAGGHKVSTVAAAELYDPSTGIFSATGPMTEPREYHTATLLADGRVLIAGGITVTYGVRTNAEADLRPGATGAGPRSNAYGPPGTNTAEMYDPKTGTFTATGSMTIARDAASAVRLSDGRVLVSGGDVNVGSPDQATIPPIPDHPTADIYDPATGKFLAAGPLRTSLSGSSAILLHDGRVLIAGGNLDTGSIDPIDVYDPATGKFSVPSSAGSKLFYHSVALLADGRVLLVGGGAALDTTSGWPTDTSECDLYDPASGKVSPAGISAGGGENALATTLLDGRVLITGSLTIAPAELYVP